MKLQNKRMRAQPHNKVLQGIAGGHTDTPQTGCSRGAQIFLYVRTGIHKERTYALIQTALQWLNIDTVYLTLIT